MRTQTLASRFEDEVTLADPVDSTGWLAPADSSDTDTPVRPAVGRRAGARTSRRAGSRVIRRGGDRRRTAERTRALSRLLPERTTVVAPAPTPVHRVEPTENGYRMSRWARLSLTVTVVATAVLVLVVLTAGPAAPALVDVTVAPGDTLWSIATNSAPDRDPRAVIDEIEQLNDVSGDVLPVGVVLRVPASAE